MMLQKRPCRDARGRHHGLADTDGEGEMFQDPQRESVMRISTEIRLNEEACTQRERCAAHEVNESPECDLPVD